MLDVQNLNAYYGKSHVLHGVNMTIGEGEIVSLLGRNGVGRSTTVMAIMGVVDATGSVRFKGEEILGQPPHKIARSGLAVIPENRDIFPTLTVRQNLLLGQKSMKHQGRWQMEEFFEMFSNLKERADVPGGALSGGEQQMLTMCRALMGDPELIMVDEPTEGLAPKIVEQIGELLTEVSRRGVSILLVEQKLTIALKVSNRVYVMGHGEIVHECTPDELMANEAVRKDWLEV